MTRQFVWKLIFCLFCFSVSCASEVYIIILYIIYICLLSLYLEYLNKVQSHQLLMVVYDFDVKKLYFVGLKS